MAWFKVDDRLAFHPKVMQAGNSAMGLWVRAGSYSAQFETDGRLTFAELSPLGARKRDIDRLVNVGLWEYVDGGVRFRDWADYQPTKAQKDAEREATNKRVKRWRERDRNGVTNGDGNGSETLPRPVPSRPDPLNTTSNEVVSRETRLSEAWAPTAEHIKRATELGLDLVTQVEKFRAHAQEKDRRAKNWNGAFTRWLINAGEYAQRDGMTQKKQPTADPYAYLEVSPKLPRGGSNG